MKLDVSCRFDAIDQIARHAGGKAASTYEHMDFGGMLREEDHPRAGRFITLGPAVRFARTPGTLRAGAPALGEHTDTVVADAGLGPDEIQRLRAQRILA